MISLKDFKESLGDEAKELTEEQILKLREQTDGFAEIMFDLWIEDEKRKQN